MLQLEKGADGLGGPPWAEPDRYRESSAVLKADKVSTPLMLIHGDLDFIRFLAAAGKDLATGEDRAELFSRARNNSFVGHFKAGDHVIVKQAANGKYPDQEWQAKHRLIALEPKR